MLFATSDPRSSGLAAAVGSVAYYVTAGAATQLYKYGRSNTAWCTIPSAGPSGGAISVTSDPRSGGGLVRPIGTKVLYVAAQVGLTLYKFGSGATDWATWTVASAAVGAHTHPESDIVSLVVDLAGKQPLDADLTALAASAATAGLVERTGAATYTTRLIGVANATDVLTRADGDARYAGIDTAIGVYGTGYDGDVTISGSTSLTRESVYNNLTIDAGVVLTVAGRPITVKGTLTNNGTIRSNGTNGSGTPGGAGGNAGAGGFLGVGSSGGSGGVGAGGSPGGASTNQPSLSGSTCAGAAGGSGTAGAGGAGGTLTALTTAGHPFSYSPAFGNFPYPSAAAVNGGTGGGGGGGNGSQNGGGGGGGGGVIVIKAKTIINNGTIEANAGNGANGNTNNCGGGGGGGGGKVFIVTRSYTGSAPTVLAGGKGLTGGGTGADGVDGNPGIVIQVAM